MVELGDGFQKKKKNIEKKTLVDSNMKTQIIFSYIRELKESIKREKEKKHECIETKNTPLIS